MGNILSGLRGSLTSRQTIRSRPTPQRFKRARESSEQVTENEAKKLCMFDLRPPLPQNMDEPRTLRDMCKRGAIIRGRFHVEEKLGRGSFGVVVRVTDTINKEFECALKISKASSDYVRDEAQILRAINRLDPLDEYHIERILGSFCWNSKYFLQLELLKMNLKEYLFRYAPNGMRMEDLKLVSLQVLEALAFLNKSDLIHCDLKPENIMLKDVESLQIKLVDFGGLERADRLQPGDTYMQTRNYRAPEIFLGMRGTPALDMWSVGCIMAELFTGKMLLCGFDAVDQMNRTVEVLGSVPQKMLKEAEWEHVCKFFRRDKTGKKFIMHALPNKEYAPPKSKSLILIFTRHINKMRFKRLRERGLFSKDEFDLIDLTSRMLKYKPAKRISARDAKTHCFFDKPSHFGQYCNIQ